MEELTGKMMLKGAYDLHIHTAPDVIPRKYDDRVTAQMIRDAGMAGMVIKSHYWETAGRAALLRRDFPELTIRGGVTLNRSVGGINPRAVEFAGKMGAGFLWFPTMDARVFQEYKAKAAGKEAPEGLLSVLDENGGLTGEALAALDVAAEYDMIVGTGHLGAKEVLLIVREGRKRGLRVVMTHVDNPAMGIKDEDQLEAVRFGAMIEHSCNDIWFRRGSMENMVRQIRLVGCDHVFLSTDAGQVNAPDCTELLGECAAEMWKRGFTESELKQMMCTNPGSLVNR